MPYAAVDGLERGFEPAATLAGIKGITFHNMRGAFASRMISRGIQLVPFSRLMGHEDARITRSRYAPSLRQAAD